jgi:hypothetical protein
MESLCLSTGLLPLEFPDLFNSACIGRLDRHHYADDQLRDAQRHLYDFKEPHLSEDTFQKLLRCSGRANREDFVMHYGTIDIKDRDPELQAAALRYWQTNFVMISRTTRNMKN